MKLIIILHLIFTSICFSQDFWEKTNLPFSDCGAVLSLAISSNGDIFTGTNNGVYLSTDNGHNWTQTNNVLSGLDVGCLNINSKGDIFAGTGILFSETKGEGIFRSTNNGDNWIQINNGLTANYIYSLAINSNGDIFAGTEDYLFRSTNNGNNWIQLNTGLTDLNVQNFDVRCFVFNTNGDIFIGTDTGGIYRSIDNGATWNQVNNGLLALDVLCIAINSNGDIFAGTQFGWDSSIDNVGIYRSTDNGNTWTHMNNGLSEIAIRCLAINSNKDIFVGTFDCGVFHSADNGENWTQINNGLLEKDVYSLDVNLEGYIFAGTDGGLYCSKTSTITGFEEDKLLPSTFTLDQNYPNPFNPSTVISYQIPSSVKSQKSKVKNENTNGFIPSGVEGENVSLKVYDILGREVATLVNEKQKPGNYEIVWNASDKPSGVYFYQLTTGEFTETKKLILMK